MKLLCLDTATRVETVALVDDGALVAEHAIRRQKGHGPAVLDDLDGLLRAAGWRLADVDRFVCGQGPGSFTGLRIALATLKGLALALDRPIHAVRTTAMVAANRPGPRTYAVLDARRGQVYVDGPGIAAPQVLDPAAVGQVIPVADPVLVGDGAVMFREALMAALPAAEIPRGAAAHQPRAAHLAELVDLSAPAALATLEPVYVRPSDAELNYPDGFPDALTRFGIGG